MVATDEHNQSKPSSSFSSQSMGREERERRMAEQEEQLDTEAKAKAKAKVAKSHPTFLGRHRMSSAMSQLNNQITILQEELNELETVSQSSIVCIELISSLEVIPDPLLPTINGLVDVFWDRWFRGAQKPQTLTIWLVLFYVI